MLSHDLLEGGFLRAGLISDLELIDDHPSRFSAYQNRLHRWVRGDWQLLLWLLPKTYNRRGELLPIDLSRLTRWQIIDNLRRSLLPPVLFTYPFIGYYDTSWSSFTLDCYCFGHIIFTCTSSIGDPSSSLQTYAKYIIHDRTSIGYHYDTPLSECFIIRCY